MELAKERVGAIIIRDKKLLLGTGANSLRFWTPGGKPEEGEEHETAMKRELAEELGVSVQSMNFYTKIVEKSWADDSPLDCYYYIVEVDGELIPSQEISEIRWASRDDIESGAVPVDEFASGILVPKLVSDGLL